jgi:hypothetical protein
MQIGVVAKKIGVSVDAIRFYERNALLPQPTRTQGGFRQYGEGDLETLAFIRGASKAGKQDEHNCGANDSGTHGYILIANPARLEDRR